MIIARNISYTYPDGKQALQKISLEIKDNVTVIMGPNGSGKTTLLKILALIYKPKEGEVIINGKNYWKLPKTEQLNIRRKIVYLHEKPKLFSGTVLENVAYPLKIRGFSENYAKSEAKRILEELGINHLEERKRNQLSAGEAQLVAYARATVIKPKYLLLDEPTNTLDHEKRRIMEEHLRKLAKQGTMVIIATHDVLLAIKTASKIITLENGQKTESTTPQQLLKELQNTVINKSKS